jgi:uncharacterized membrane protein YfcA
MRAAPVTLALIGSFCIVMFAAAAHAATGFGFALVGVPLLTLTVDPHTAVVALTTVDLVLTLTIVVRERPHILWRSAIVVTVAGLAGIPLGLYALATLSGRTLAIGIALVVLVFTAALACGFRLPRASSTEIAAGVGSGVLLAATGMNGPPLVAAFQAMRLEPRQFRATLQAVFAVQALAVVAGFALTDQFTSRGIEVALVAIPAIFVGWKCGDRMFHRIPRRHYRRVVLAAMAVSACLALVTALS